MVHVKIFLMRHSRSCSNLARDNATTEEQKNASQQIRDPALSQIGLAMARSYGPRLAAKLRSLGFSLQSDTAILGSSYLRRARETIAALFPNRTYHLFSHFKEYGDIPENTPAGILYQKPNFKRFMQHISEVQVDTGATEFVIVGHGSFLRVDAWASLSPTLHKRFSNLDGFLIEADMESGHLKNIQLRDVPHRATIPTPTSTDGCLVPQPLPPAKIAARTKRMVHRGRKSQKQKQKQHNQKGGGSMPLAYFKDGAQFMGTYAEPTGVGIGVGSGSMIRDPITQTGGRRTQKQQQGGFSPSVMGSFVEVGTRLVPVAAYMGYKLWTGKKNKSRRTRKGRR
jgi:broad specificity phosphatase PhoE